MDNFAIIPAAGQGVRLGRGTKKQFLPLKGLSLLDHVLTRFVETGLFLKIVVCLPRDELSRFREDWRFPNVLWVEGGKSRGESVRHGFEALVLKKDDVVLIHDAARPLVSLDLIRRVVTAVPKFGAVIPAIPISDTIKEVVEEKIERTVDRKNLMLAQTPQGFLAQILEKAYDKCDATRLYTDEAMLVEEGGQSVFIVEGERTNFKVTTEFDLKMAEFLADR